MVPVCTGKHITRLDGTALVLSSDSRKNLQPTNANPFFSTEISLHKPIALHPSIRTLTRLIVPTRHWSCGNTGRVSLRLRGRRWSLDLISQRPDGIVLMFVYGLAIGMYMGLNGRGKWFPCAKIKDHSYQFYLCTMIYFPKITIRGVEV